MLIFFPASSKAGAIQATSPKDFAIGEIVSPEAVCQTIRHKLF
jgi:hypothetical protein